jgi:hypothetical protein
METTISEASTRSTLRMASISQELGATCSALTEDARTMIGSESDSFDMDEKSMRRAKYGLKDFGDWNEIVGILFTRTGGEVKNKPLLDALISIGHNRLNLETGVADWFPASHESLHHNLTGEAFSQDSKERKNQSKSIKRKINRLQENQTVAGVTWVEYKPGRRDGNRLNPKNVPSSFRLVILERAADAYFRVKKNPARYEPTGPGSKWKNAALEVADEILKNCVALTEANKRPKIQTLEQVRKTIIGYLRKFRDSRYEQGCDYEFVLEEVADIVFRAMNGESNIAT